MPQQRYYTSNLMHLSFFMSFKFGQLADALIRSVHFSYLVCRGNQTHNPGVASTLLYQLSHTGHQMQRSYLPFYGIQTWCEICMIFSVIVVNGRGWGENLKSPFIRGLSKVEQQQRAACGIIQYDHWLHCFNNEALLNYTVAAIWIFVKAYPT